MISKGPRQRVSARPVEAAPSGPPLSRTLIDVFAAAVVRCPERTAIDAPDRRLSYAELADCALALAERLRGLGIGPGDRVGIRVASGTAELYLAILGVLHAGAAYVPVDADDPPGRAAMIWEVAGACAVIEQGLSIAIREDPRGRGRELTVDCDAWVIFTSGSTGQPKGVAVSHRAAAAFVDAEAGLWSVGPGDRVLAGLSVAFDASCEEMWLAWRNGAALVPAPRELVRAGAELGPWLAQRGVTVISTVPTLAAMWGEADLAGVRLLILGGEACPEPLAWKLAAVPGREVWNTYGPTEATVVTTAARLRPQAPVTIGWPLRGWEVAIVDGGGEPVAVGEAGELVIAGVGLGRYLDPGLDAERYAPLRGLGWDRAYRTGDIVRDTLAGIQFIGRRDDQVKLGGRRIELGEVEAQLNAVPGVRAAAAAIRLTDAGNPLLVGYVVGNADPGEVRAAAAQRLPEGSSPLVFVVDSLPISSSGKVDRKALPWPPPQPNGTTPGAAAYAGADACASDTVAWLAERWAEQLGPLPITLESDFFELGGSSLAAAKLVSTLRQRYPAVAIADVYQYRHLGALALRLDELRSSEPGEVAALPPGARRWGAAQLAGMLLMLVLRAPQWIVGILAVDRVWGLWGGQLGPQVGWAWLIAGWLVFASAPGRALIVLIARRALLGELAPGRYPRHGWLASRLWFIEHLSAGFRLNSLGGTPFAARYARLSGHEVGRDVRLMTLPPAASLIRIGDGAVIEKGVDLHGWWIVGDELVVGELMVGKEARVGARSQLLPGASVGDGAEIEPGSVLVAAARPGERWAGVPARRIGTAGRDWPAAAPPCERRRRLWKAMYLVGLALENLLPLVAALPSLVIVLLVPGHATTDKFVDASLATAPTLVALYIMSFGVLTALLFRLVSRALRPGWHGADGASGWALWFSGGLMEEAMGVLFPIYSSVYTRAWLRLLGVSVGRRTEMSHAVTLNRLTRLGETSMGADDVGFVVSRLRGGWLQLAKIEVGSRTFLGNSSIVNGASSLADDSLIGVLTGAPRRVAAGSSWFGCPALELPRVPESADPSRTTNPPKRLVLARGTVELGRILFPATVSMLLGLVLFWALNHLGSASGPWAMLAAAPGLLLAAGICAALITIAAKWLIIGRYRPSQHPLWSHFVWRDEVINSCQEMLAGAWLLQAALGTPLLPVYLRAMGAKVGRDVWFETMNVTEFDVVELGDGCVVNRGVHVETHLFHDRLLRIGPTRVGPGATLGPESAVLPDTIVGAGTRVGGRSVVMRGEELPPGTNWHGAPVVSV